MLKLPQYDTSYWRQEYTASSYPQLKENIEVDVTVIGAGITGLTSAYLLKQAGLTVAVLEKATVGAGTTGRTTGKVTSQHNLVYYDLQKRLGKKVAQTYGQANQAALELVASIIAKQKISCDWQKQDNYVYTTDPQQVETFKQEAQIATSLGLPATYETKTPLPFDVQAAVKFWDQGKLHSQKYLLGLARDVHGNGSYVFEHSLVVGIRDGNPGRVKTKRAHVISKDIIVATNVPTLPLIARGAYCLLEYPKESYIVAGHLEKELSGMYISPDKGQYSILPVVNATERLLLVGGEGHISGLRGSIAERYQKLANYAEKHFGLTSIDYKWSDRDYLSYDGLPLVGKLYPWSHHLYVASAFNKWGLSNGTVAAMILRDHICGQKNLWATTFDSTRTSPITSIPRVVAKYLSGNG